MATASSRTPALATNCPDRVATIRRPGRTAHQVLVQVGSGVLTGWGLRSHEEGLPGAVADALAARSGRGVDLTVIADPEVTSDRALEALPGLRLRRFDALVVVLGEDPAAQLLSPADWKRRATGLLAALVSHVDTGRRVFVYASSRAMLANSQSPSGRVWRPGEQARHLPHGTSMRPRRRAICGTWLLLHRIGLAAHSPHRLLLLGGSNRRASATCAARSGRVARSSADRVLPETVPRTRNCGRQRWKRCTWKSAGQGSSST